MGVPAPRLPRPTRTHLYGTGIALSQGMENVASSGKRAARLEAWVIVGVGLAGTVSLLAARYLFGL